MPTLTPKIAKLKASNLIKSYSAAGFNQSRLARMEGVSQSAINQRFKHLPVQTPLQEALRKIGITTQYKARKFKELMEAKKLHGERGQEVEDNTTRIKTLQLLCHVDKDINDDKSGGVRVINIIRTYLPQKKTEEDVKQPSH